ncbi:MAG: hypothetical protein ABGY75_11255 [Gemmataceae bacterium]
MKKVRYWSVAAALALGAAGFGFQSEPTARAVSDCSGEATCRVACGPACPPCPECELVGCAPCCAPECPPCDPTGAAAKCGSGKAKTGTAAGVCPLGCPPCPECLDCPDCP